MEYSRAYSLTGSTCIALSTIASLFIPKYLLALQYKLSIPRCLTYIGREGFAFNMNERILVLQCYLCSCKHLSILLVKQPGLRLIWFLHNSLHLLNWLDSNPPRILCKYRTLRRFSRDLPPVCGLLRVPDDMALPLVKSTQRSQSLTCFARLPRQSDLRSFLMTEECSNLPQVVADVS